MLRNTLSTCVPAQHWPAEWPFLKTPPPSYGHSFLYTMPHTHHLARRLLTTIQDIPTAICSPDGASIDSSSACGLHSSITIQLIDWLSALSLPQCRAFPTSRTTAFRMLCEPLPTVEVQLDSASAQCKAPPDFIRVRISPTCSDARDVPLVG